MNSSLIEASKAFNVSTDCTPFGNGHINSTFLAYKDSETYILQRINTNVFKNPENMMSNICKVTDHIKEKIKEQGGDIEREVVSVLKTNSGEMLYKTEAGETYRAYKYIKDSVTIDGNITPDEFYQAGYGFGLFQSRLSDFPAEGLYEIIEKFHDTPSRLERLKNTINEDKCGRLSGCEEIVEYVLKYEKDASLVTDGIKSGDIPLRVTHNDTKLNNILFDKDTKKALCVIDLDTVMPGSLLYDFGDAIRYGASTAAEDEVDLDKVSVDLKLFEAYTKGFTSQLKHSMTKAECELMSFSAKLMTYELAIRFLDDYLAGDVYFKTKYPEHNLIRAKNQLKICRDIDLKMNDMNKIVKEILK